MLTEPVIAHLAEMLPSREKSSLKATIWVEDTTVCVEEM